jgi:undecaprenyl-phosphate 4-deoxy-4-formamido-L-arabinose transferase
MISIIVPVYGKGRSLKALYRRLEIVMDRMGKRTQFEVIFVDDCGPKEAFSVIEELVQACDCITGIRLKENVGQQNATYCGMHYASGELIVTIDDDLQHEPELIQALIGKLSPDTDLIYGVASGRKDKQHRQFGSKLTNLFFRRHFKVLGGKRVSSFRAFSKELNEAVINREVGFVYISCLLLAKCEGVDNLIIPFTPRAEGKSNYTLTRLVALFTQLVINYGSLASIYKAYFKSKTPCFQIDKIIGKGAQGVNNNENNDAGRRYKSAVCN